MTIRPLIEFLRKYPLGLMLGIERDVNRFYRSCFISSILAQPFAEQFANHPLSLEELARQSDIPTPCPELEAWLDFGVSVGALTRSRDKYRLKSKLARSLAGSQGTWKAFYRIRIEEFSKYILLTPTLLANGGSFTIDDAQGALYAESSRTMEPSLKTFTNNIVPKSGAYKLLEVGCGAGVYIRCACESNPDLIAVGIERQPSAARLARDNMKQWGLTDRVNILDTDFMNHTESGYNLITLHNLIYYFPKNERRTLLAHARSLLAPGGTVVLTTLCQGKHPALRAMDLWASMNRGGGPLPRREDVSTLMQEAGFTTLTVQELIPELRCWVGTA